MARNVKTESDWLKCSDTDKMLRFLGNKVSGRKKRLFGCACCRLLWAYLPGKRCRQVLVGVEDLADGKLSANEFDRVRYRNMNWIGRWKHEQVRQQAAYAVNYVSWPADDDLVVNFASNAVLMGFYDLYGGDNKLFRAEERRIADLGRDIFGNPFRPLSLDSSWLVWNGSAVRKLAQVIYDERQFDDMPILADALEEAGCDSADILEHCRGAGPHVKGCWVLDLLLGKG